MCYSTKLGREFIEGVAEFGVDVTLIYTIVADRETASTSHPLRPFTRTPSNVVLIDGHVTARIGRGFAGKVLSVGFIVFPV